MPTRTLQDDAEQLRWAWTRLLVGIGVGRARTALLRWLRTR